MDDDVVHSFAAETEQDIEAWLVALKRVIQSNEMGSIEKIRGAIYHSAVLLLFIPRTNQLLHCGMLVMNR